MHHVHHHNSAEDTALPPQRVARELKKLARRDDVYEHLAQSLAPEIFGHLDVKKALLLQMVGTNRGRDSFKAESRA